MFARCERSMQLTSSDSCVLLCVRVCLRVFVASGEDPNAKGQAAKGERESKMCLMLMKWIGGTKRGAPHWMRSLLSCIDNLTQNQNIVLHVSDEYKHISMNISMRRADLSHALPVH